jgi:hypothetical protein
MIEGSVTDLFDISSEGFQTSRQLLIHLFGFERAKGHLLAPHLLSLSFTPGFAAVGLSETRWLVVAN